MYVVLDLHYTKEEGQECFQGTYEECENFIQDQGSCYFMYKIVYETKR